MPPSESQKLSAESVQQTFSKEVNTAASNNQKMTASEPKKIISKSKSKSALDEKPNGAKKALSKSRTQGTLKEVNTSIITGKNDSAMKIKNIAKEENSSVEKKQKKSLAKSKTNTDLKNVDPSVNSVPVRSLVKSKTLVKFDNVGNMNAEVKSETLTCKNEENKSSEKQTKTTLTESKSSNGLHDFILPSKPVPAKSLAKSKTVSKLKSAKSGSNEDAIKPMRKYKSQTKIVEVNEPISVIVDHRESKDDVTTDKKLVNCKSVGTSKTLPCISEEVASSENQAENKPGELKKSNCAQESIVTTKGVPLKSLAKSKTVAKLKSAKANTTEEPSKSMRKCKSQTQLREANIGLVGVADDQKFKVEQIDLHLKDANPSPAEKIPSTDSSENCMNIDTGSESMNLDCVTPKTVSKAHKDRLKKLAFSDVSVFFFNRTQGYCSIPRDGGNTIGMDMKHSHQEKRKLFEDAEPMVKRKLFSFDRSSSLEMKDLKEETEHVEMSEKPEISQLTNTASGKKSFLVDEDDFEISFKASVKPQVISANEVEDTKSKVDVISNTDQTLGIETGLFQACINSPDRVQLDFVPEKNSLDHSPSFKRSLSLSISEDDLAFPWKPLRKNSISFDPPRKSQKPSQHSKTLRSSVSSFNLQPHLAYRSSPRLSNIKSTSSLLSENLTTPKLGKICKKNESLRKSAFRQSQSNGLSKAFSKVDIKLSDMVDEKPTEGLPKPGEDLVQSISRNCLRSFRKFSLSPESIVTKPDTKPEIDEKPSKIVTDMEIVPETPLSNTAPQCRGSNSSSKRSKKKGECGTRGLTPLNSKARFSLLKSYGILNIDKVEAEEIRNIRESREQCGCSCRGDCKPETCECAKNGIECQVERLGFPCKCGVGCKNPNGRKVFDEMEVSLHFINTMMNMKGVLDISGSEENLCQNQQIDER